MLSYCKRKGANVTHLKQNVIAFPGSSRLSFGDFLAQAQRHRVKIQAIQSSLEEASHFLNDGRSVYPDYCDDIVTTLQSINAPLQDFCQLLDARMYLPTVVSSLRYPLLRILHQIDALIAELILLIAAFQTNCQVSSRRMIMQRREIQRKVELLVMHIEEIGQTVDRLPEQTQFLMQA